MIDDKKKNQDQDMATEDQGQAGGVSQQDQGMEDVTEDVEVEDLDDDAEDTGDTNLAE